MLLIAQAQAYPDLIEDFDKFLPLSTDVKAMHRGGRVR